jgi:hypothetical protein
MNDPSITETEVGDEIIVELRSIAEAFGHHFCSIFNSLFSINIPNNSDITYSDFLVFRIQGVPKRYIHKVNIPYYNVHTSFWDTLYF